MHIEPANIFDLIPMKGQQTKNFSDKIGLEILKGYTGRGFRIERLPTSTGSKQKDQNTGQDQILNLHNSHYTQVFSGDFFT